MLRLRHISDADGTWYCCFVVCGVDIGVAQCCRAGYNVGVQLQLFVVLYRIWDDGGGGVGGGGGGSGVGGIPLSPLLTKLARC